MVELRSNLCKPFQPVKTLHLLGDLPGVFSSDLFCQEPHEAIQVCTWHLLCGWLDGTCHGWSSLGFARRSASFHLTLRTGGLWKPWSPIACGAGSVFAAEFLLNGWLISFARRMLRQTSKSAPRCASFRDYILGWSMFVMVFYRSDAKRVKLK